MTPTYILIGARKRVGKDTSANYLTEVLRGLGQCVFRTSFADALKHDVQIMADAVGFPCNAYTEDSHEKEKIVRPMLIAYGMARRAIDPNYWIDRVVKNSETVVDATLPLFPAPKEHKSFVIISDWRFPNELKRLRELRKLAIGIVLRRPQVPNSISEEIENEPLCAKLSDFTVLNDGDIPKLQGQLNWVGGQIVRELSTP